MKRKEPPPAPQRLHKFAARTNPTLKIEKSTASTTSVDGACGVDTFASKGESTTTLSSIGKQGIESGEDGMRSDVDDKVSVSTEAKRSNTPSVHDEEEDDAASWVAGNESAHEIEHTIVYTQLVLCIVLSRLVTGLSDRTQCIGLSVPDSVDLPRGRTQWVERTQSI